MQRAKHQTPGKQPLNYCLNACCMEPAMKTTNANNAVAKSKLPGDRKKKTARRSAKLKSSKWYQGAARSIGITKQRSLENGDDEIK